MKINENFIPRQPYTELFLRRFPIPLYQKLNRTAKQYHITITSLVTQCCAFALDCMGEENT